MERSSHSSTTSLGITARAGIACRGGYRVIGHARRVVRDEVLARDEHTGATSVREIEAVLVHADLITGTVVIDGEAIETTPEHPFFSLDRGFVPAADLRPGELVATASGDPGVVSSVTWAGGPAVMWNLTVGIDHTFFVGTGGWWVHNACKISPVAPDWATKGAHVKADGVELAVRPGQGGSIVFKPVFGSTSPGELAGAMKTAQDALRDPKFVSQLSRDVARARDYLRGLGTDMARARAGELTFLVKALAKIGD